MRLSLVLFRRNLLPNGHISRGKDKIIKRVEPRTLRQIKEDYAIEEQNMLYLRHPYLTEAQSFGHAKELGKAEKRINGLQEQTRRIFKPDVTLFERLLHLRVSEGWDK